MKFRRCASFGLFLVALAGCGSVNTVSTRTAPSEDSVESRKQINDLLTEVFLHARDVRMNRTPGGMLEAQVDVANDDFRTRGFSYKFTWLTDRGSVIDSPMSVWKTARLPSGGSMTISSVAPNQSATDFNLQVRRAE